MKNNKILKLPATLLTLHDVFEGRLFSIPDYQRGYSWGKEQVKALHKDIEQLFNSDHLHFTGTIVLTQDDLDSRNNKDKGVVYEIVDGQQRLTTVFILLHELIRELDSNQLKKDSYEHYIGRGEEGNRTDVFKLNSQIDPYFRAHISGNEEDPKPIEYFSEKRLKACKRETKKWIESIRKEKDKTYLELFNLVTRKLGFIVYQPEHSSEAGMMFEVINNRGKPLSEFEKVKNYLIYYAIKENKQELREAIDASWGEILKNIASAHKLQSIEENTFLRGVSITFLGLNKKQASQIYTEVKNKYPIGNEAASEDWKEIKEFVLFMKRCSFYYAALLNENSVHRQKLDKDLASYIELIRSQSSHANLLPLYFAVMDKREKLDKDKLLDVFKALEIVNFRVYMTTNGASRTDSGQGKLYSIAHGFFSSFGGNSWWLRNATENDEIQYEDNVSVLISKLGQLVNNIIPDKSFVDGFKLEPDENYDFYKWKGIRYFLMNYERQINSKRTIKIENILLSRQKGKSNDYCSIEHVWAQKNKSKKKFHNGEDVFQKSRLGNFILLELGINSQARHKDIWDKVEIYSTINTGDDKSVLKQVDYLIDDFKNVKVLIDKKHEKRKGVNYHYEMHTNTISKNEERLIAFAEKRWSLDWAKKYSENFNHEITV